MKAGIKNILFDLGNVLIDIDFMRTIQAFQKLGWSDFHLDLDPSDSVFLDFEIGKISRAQFISYWLNKLPNCQPDEIIRAWNALLIGVTPDKLTLLASLKECYRLFIYSNTNELHIDWINDYFSVEHHQPQWTTDLFHGVYYSYTLGIRKPSPLGFKKIINNERILPHETLFIDDHLPNLQAAQSVGLRVLHKELVRSLSDLISTNLPI